MSDATKYFILSALVTAVLSVPSWLPAFGIEPAWFGFWLIEIIQRALPLITLAVGMFLGWKAHARAHGREAEAVTAEDKSEPTPLSTAVHTVKAERAEEERELERKSLEIAEKADRFEKMPFDAQAVVCMVHDGGDLKMPSSWRSMTDDPSWFAQRWMTWRALPDGEDLWRLTEPTRELLEARPDLLEPARDYLEELAAERAEEDARKRAAERFERARRSPDYLISCIGTVAELRTLDWIVGEGGRYDEGDVPDYYDVATLDNLGLIDRYCPDVMTDDVVAVLDDEVQRSFEDMENVNLIYAKIAELQEMEDLDGRSGKKTAAGEPGESAVQPEPGPHFEKRGNGNL